MRKHRGQVIVSQEGKERTVVPERVQRPPPLCYKGQWHTSQTLGTPPAHLPWRIRKRPRRATSSKARTVSVRSLNAGGLNSSMYQEVLAWCDQQASLDIVILQETHWGQTGDFTSGKWLTMHTAGSPDPAAHARFSGILVDPCVQELVPGRLVLQSANCCLWGVST